MTRKWEYKVLSIINPIENELNLLGDEGWELVTAVYDSDADMVDVVFKREKT